MELQVRNTQQEAQLALLSNQRIADLNSKPEELIQTLLKYLDDGQLKEDLARCFINLLAVGKNFDTSMCK